MADDHGARDAELIEGRAQPARLGERRPERAARPRAVAVTRPVEGEYVKFPRCALDETAQLEVFQHAAQPVQQHDGNAESAFHIVKPRGKAADPRMLALSAAQPRVDK
jgi:hypothetical protein